VSTQLILISTSRRERRRRVALYRIAVQKVGRVVQ
jgi:hypothetical protein